jgi:hypothetical protein
LTEGGEIMGYFYELIKSLQQKNDGRTVAPVILDGNEESVENAREHVFPIRKEEMEKREKSKTRILG